MDFSPLTFHLSPFEVIGAVIGLLYVISEYRADRWFWPLSLLMSAFYAVIDFTSGIYANGAICCYNFVMSIYGLLVWRGVISRNTRPRQPQAAATPSNLEGEPDGNLDSSPKLGEGDPGAARVEECDKERRITSCPRRYWWQIITVIVLLSALLSWQLGYLNQSTYNLPSGRTLNLSLLDGISSALTIVGMLMLAQKWWQQWFCWMLVEPLMIALFILTGNYASAVLYAVFEVFCILGVIRWKKESIS